ncbi:MAG: hypothetical protein WCG96_11305, partial [Actinomycetes bacterium]
DSGSSVRKDVRVQVPPRPLLSDFLVAPAKTGTAKGPPGGSSCCDLNGPGARGWCNQLHVELPF